MTDTARESAQRRPGAHPALAAKVGLVVGALALIATIVAGLLLVQLRQATAAYDGILGSEVRAAQQAREMQVTFARQLQDWDDLLLRGINPADLATFTQRFRDDGARVDQLATELSASSTDTTVPAEVAQFAAEHQALAGAQEAALAAFVAGGAQDPRAPDAAVRDQDRAPADHIGALAARLEASTADRVAAKNAEIASRQRALTIVSLVALLLLLGTLAVVVAGIVRPVRAMTQAARDAARRGLPDAVRRIRSARADEPPPQMPAIEVRSRPELRDLAAAITELQTSAVQLAHDQRRAERESADMLVNLGRRNQSLLRRTLAYISELESEENDPQTLARLFRLDHATTRIRRNAESMLVLAGAEQTRTWSRPVPIGEVVRAAMSEIEDYARVDPHHLDDTALIGAAVADVVHLVAELTENATHFSPPETRVVVVGQHVPEGYRLRIQDRGVGMTHAELEAANARIAEAAEGHTDSPLLGHYVVGRLAARRGITVRLEPSAEVGLTASITLPAKLLVARPEPDAEPAADAEAPPVPRPRRSEPAAPSPAAAPIGSAMASLAMQVAGRRTEPGRPSVDGPVPLAQVDAEGHPDWFGILASGAAQDTVPPGIPRRVRGAQLPDLGDTRSGQEFAVPDPEQVRRQLAALHRGVDRAHAEQQEADAPARPRSGPALSAVPDSWRSRR
jgi:Histidine kinase-, DNA gyrase B-, and HSP90-like ATPase